MHTFLKLWENKSCNYLLTLLCVTYDARTLRANMKYKNKTKQNKYKFSVLQISQLNLDNILLSTIIKEYIATVCVFLVIYCVPQ